MIYVEVVRVMTYTLAEDYKSLLSQLLHKSTSNHSPDRSAPCVFPQDCKQQINSNLITSDDIQLTGANYLLMTIK